MRIIIAIIALLVVIGFSFKETTFNMLNTISKYLLVSPKIIEIDPDIDKQSFSINTDHIMLKIPSNPTTGYNWYIVQSSTGANIESTDYDRTKSDRIGSGGFTLIQIQFDSGWNKESITLIYKRAFESDQQDSNKSLKIEFINLKP